MVSLKENSSSGLFKFLVLFDGAVINRISESKLYQYVDADVMIHFENGIRINVNDYLGENICSIVRESFYF